MNSKEVAEKFRKKYVLQEGTIKVGDKVKYLEKPMQGADFFLETEPTEVVKVNSKTVVFNNRRTSIPTDRVYPYSGYKKITGGKKNGRQMWVPKNKLNEGILDTPKTLEKWNKTKSTILGKLPKIIKVTEWSSTSPKMLTITLKNIKEDPTTSIEITYTSKNDKVVVSGDDGYEMDVKNKTFKVTDSRGILNHINELSYEIGWN